MNKEKLYRKIFITRCSRIILAEELKRKHEFFQNLIVYYSTAIIAFSILEITTSYGNSSYILITSIALSFFTVAIQSQKHLERYLSLKQHYISLDDLGQRLEDDISSDETEKIRVRYNGMLEQVENHNLVHMHKHIMKDSCEWPSKNNKEKFIIWLSVFIYDARWCLIKAFLVLFPFIIPLFDNLISRAKG